MPPKKSGPGRPRKNPIPPEIKTQGIVNKPIDKTNCIEFIYNDPQKIKSTLSLFKTKEFKHKDITFKFEKEHIYIYSQSSSGTQLLICLNCAETSSYFYGCKNKDLVINIEGSKLEDVFNTIDKTKYKIVIGVRHNCHEELRITFCEHKLDTEDSHNIDVAELPQNKELDNLIKSINKGINGKVLLKFQIPSSRLKQILKSASSKSDKIKIQKKYNDKFRIESKNESHKTQYKCCFNDEKKIKLESLVDKNNRLFFRELDINKLITIKSPVVEGMVTVEFTKDFCTILTHIPKTPIRIYTTCKSQE